MFEGKSCSHGGSSATLVKDEFIGKLAEGSDKLAPRIEFWAQDLDKKNFLRLGSLRERKFQGNEWKSLLHLFY